MALVDPVQLHVAVVVRSISFDEGVGGLERAANLHIQGLLDSGVRVSLYAPPSFVRGKIPSNIRFHAVDWPVWGAGPGSPLMGISYRRWTFQVATVLQRTNDVPDVLHLHGASACVLSALGRAYRESIAVVTNPHGLEEFSRGSWRNWPNRIVLRKMSRFAVKANAVVATDGNLVSVIQRHLRVGPPQTVVIPNSVDVEQLHYIAKQVVSPEVECFQIVSVGRLVRNKGYDLLVEAFKSSALRDALPLNWVWLHFGSGSERRNLERQMQLAPVVPGRIVSNATDAEVQHALSTSNLFVQPSRYEGSSLTTLEAMAHGARVVATPVGGIPDKIIDGDTGFLATEVSVESLVSAILRAMGTKKDTGLSASNLVAARYDVRSTTDQYVELYTSLIDAELRK